MDIEFEVTTADVIRWAQCLKAEAMQGPQEAEVTRMRTLAAYLMFNFADTLREELNGQAGIQMPGPRTKDLN